MTQPNQPKKQDIIVTRIIDAPIEEVWKAWTNPEYVKRWWGPLGYSSPSCKIDLRVGGKYVFSMQAPPEQGGQVSYTAGTYKAIVPQERLEFTQSLSDKDGNLLEPAQVGMPPDFPKEIPTTVELKRYRCDMTELTVTEHDWVPSQVYIYSIAGLNQTVDKIIKSLKEA